MDASLRSANLKVLILYVRVPDRRSEFGSMQLPKIVPSYLTIICYLTKSCTMSSSYSFIYWCDTLWFALQKKIFDLFLHTELANGKFSAAFFSIVGEVKRGKYFRRVRLKNTSKLQNVRDLRQGNKLKEISPGVKWFNCPTWRSVLMCVATKLSTQRNWTWGHMNWRDIQYGIKNFTVDC